MWWVSWTDGVVNVRSPARWWTGLVAWAFWLAVMGSCGDVVQSWGADDAMSYCQDMAGTYHFQVFAPPWKYRREYECTDGDFKNCNHWEPTGRYVFVVTDVPYVSYDSEIVDLLRVEFLSGKDALKALDERLSEIHADDRAEVLPQDGEEYSQTETKTGLFGYQIFWRQMREHDGDSFKWYRRDVYLDGDRGAFHLEMFSVGSLDRPDFNALVASFAQGPAPDQGTSCRCMDELADPPTLCVP